jgi:hypothetical protein
MAPQAGFNRMRVYIVQISGKHLDAIAELWVIAMQAFQ